MALELSIQALNLAFSFLVAEEQEKPDYSNSFHERSHLGLGDKGMRYLSHGL